MKANGHYETVNDKSYVRIYGTSNTLKAIMELESGYVVDSVPDNSLRTMLGFNAQTYYSPYNESPNPVNILIELKIESLAVVILESTYPLFVPTESLSLGSGPSTPRFLSLFISNSPENPEVPSFLTKLLST